MPSSDPDDAPSFLDRVRRTCRRRQYSYHTEKAYVRWVVRYVRFHDTTHPRRLGADDVRAFLTHLAADRNVAAATQNQAPNALTFLYDRVLDAPLGDLGAIERADRPRRLPTVLSRDEVRRLFRAFSPGDNRLVAHLLYGSGLRLSEALRLRAPLHRHLQGTKLQFEEDRANDVDGVYLPNALTEKYPNAPTEWRWQYVFPSPQLSEDPRSGAVRRHHRSDSAVQRAVKKAVDAAGIEKHATCHTLRPAHGDPRSPARK